MIAGRNGGSVLSHSFRQSLLASQPLNPVRPFLGPIVGLGAHVVVLSGLIQAGIAPFGWILGLVYGLCVTGLLGHALHRSGRARLGPADKVTLARSTLVGGVLALVISNF